MDWGQYEQLGVTPAFYEKMAEVINTENKQGSDFLVDNDQNTGSGWSKVTRTAQAWASNANIMPKTPLHTMTQALARAYV